MKRIFHTLFVFFLSLNCVGQILSSEAVFYNTQIKPFCIERKYLYNENESILYLKLTNTNCLSLKVNEAKVLDTIVISEQYGIVHRDKTKVERLAQGDGWTISPYENGDSMILTATTYDRSDTLFRIIEIGDTLLTGINLSEQASFITDSLKYEIVPMILKGKISINPDSIYTNETVKTFLLNDFPVKVEIYDSRNQLIRRTKFTYKNRSLEIEHYDCSIPNKLKTLRHDRLTWNNDTSIVKWKRCRPGSKDNYEISYLLAPDRYKLMIKDSIYKEEYYLNPTNVFKYIILDNTTYDDAWFDSQFFNLEKRPLRTTRRQGLVVEKEYIYDTQRRIESIHVKENNGLISTVTINYK